jgi:plastocyanin
MLKTFRPLVALAAIVGSLPIAIAAQDPVAQPGTTIRGRVELRRQPPQGEGRPDVSALGMPAAHRESDRRRGVVYLETAPRGAFDARDDARARIDQRNETFVPRVLAIVAGTTVDFPNSDVTYHNVFSFSKTRSFDLGRYAAGRTRSVRFDRPGIVRVFCDIHSHMSAHILVFAHRYFAVTDEDGDYRIDDVPPGTYTVSAWRESEPLQSRRVVASEAGGATELNFPIGR